ncbi:MULTISPECIES: UDP-N-acetylmuramoyl-L-alanyl-D-glutamate--2,6-diaminopimelate ligase [Petrotoga]|uniref:UDP-N-acetylmuramyl-tripeptide synthetase n=4 Tax=Petrotoga TaxID=28236 RepID=A0A4R8EUN8_9BACT|nr:MULTISPECIES: UDP-N-acetylmuramoyl-L-alanyl-D-glutamate--2,6-diaminopimelate ligase [Petrotoga]PNR98066.1 UDP-N-acetylmuramyl peptide synthase [Petrotoga olearia DSM 13574]POZ87893.1 UDP-N-acetylmuramyl peptide synthase [Petrotoga sibirica DSM 13575]POZ89926.1 UDP-N-acetylmuramyl peptide synthase [Petrotoga sp. SL27]RMA75659.1 UDP-N-acetylmuramoylalanyl-D-glutamate--2,6-diaminopimelate ligase [Petrotoga olearia]TDX16119.1 UDP-N-acetylmuramoylalanyl-D-glutamate--2,6-diaminopimelate ligase [P
MKIPSKKIIQFLNGNIKKHVITNEILNIADIKDNSENVEKDDIFIAFKGSRFDGHDYIISAFNKGASLIIAQDEEKIPNIDSLQYIIVEDIKKAAADLTHKLYDISLDDFKILGVTGTNGKSTTVSLVHHILQKLDKNSTLISTVGIKINDELIDEPYNTTPSILELAKILKKSKENNIEFINIEVSSHAIDQRRIQGFKYDIISYTNITRDHLDYHKDFEEYKNIKLSLMNYLKDEGTIIINLDRLNKEDFLKSGKEIITYGFDKNADFVIDNYEQTLQQMKFTITTKENKSFEIRSPMIGKFNVYNITNAFVIATLFGLAPEEIIYSIFTFKGVPGRFQIVPGSKSLGFFAVIDFAHTPDALNEVLKTASSITEGRIITVFGAGGNADKGKRKLMGQVVSEHSDVIVLTNDDPKDEDPDQIIEDVSKGIDQDKHFIVIPDRETAIDTALRFANKGDIVIIAGRGHEKYQLFANGKKVKFNDYEVTKKLIDKIKRSSGR